MFKGLGQMGDMGKMMKAAQEMQEKMAALQEEMHQMTVEGQSGAGLVKAVATAKRFMNEAIRTAVTMGSGHGPVNHFQAASSILHQPARTGEKETGS